MSKKAPVWTFWGLLLLMFVVGFTLMGVSAVSRVQRDEKTGDSNKAAKQPPTDRDSNHARKSALDLLDGLGEALMIAALLAAVVDPYAKFRLGKEIGREIAKDTLGEHLPIELREALEGIQDIGLYLRRMTVDAVLEPDSAHPGFLVWRMTIRYEVENSSWTKRPYEHRASIADSAAARADGKFIEVSHYVNGDCKYKLDGSNPQLVSMCKKEDGVTLFAHPDKHKIPSGRQGVTEECVYFHSTERLVPDSEIQLIQVSLPTVGINITVKHPEGISINASLEYVDGISPEIPEGERKGRAVRWKSKRAARGVFLRTREMIGKGMKTADFKGELTPNGHIAVPPDIVALVPPGKQILVALQWGISEDDSAWRAAGRRQFEAAYAPADSIYESLI